MYYKHVRRRLSLSTYIPLLLAAATIIPLLVTVTSIELFLRPALVSQVSSALESDAQKRVQAIDAYVVERLNDIQSVSQLTPVKNLLAGNQDSKNLAFNALFSAQHRDVANYLSWSLLNTKGTVVFSYPSAPLPHGKYYILPEAQQQLQVSGKTIISDVFYDTTKGNATVDLYARVLNDNFGILGFVRASLSLSRIWTSVNGETAASGTGSYGFILDQNNVRISYTDPNPLGTTRPAPLFQSTGPLSTTLIERIKNENLYGGSTSSVNPQQDTTLQNIQNNKQAPPTFAINPNEQNQTFEAAKATSTVVPWTYFILKPLSSVTGIADQQLLSILLTVAFVLVLVVLVGLVVGRRVAHPILLSVTSLRQNSQSLKQLANEEHTVANEQSWMVEASQAGLQSVRYYTDASSIAVQHIHTVSEEIVRDLHRFDERKLRKSLNDIVESTKYIKQAIDYQAKMNEKLLTTLRVTTHATEQLTHGAEATDDAATQLEHIVSQLTSAVGGQDTDRAKTATPT